MTNDDRKVLVMQYYGHLATVMNTTPAPLLSEGIGIALEAIATAAAVAERDRCIEDCHFIRDAHRVARKLTHSSYDEGGVSSAEECAERIEARKP
ncbi:MAG: hypothetical protein WC563_15140 [Brevundimonas sp.]